LVSALCYAPEQIKVFERTLTWCVERVMVVSVREPPLVVVEVEGDPLSSR